RAVTMMRIDWKKSVLAVLALLLAALVITAAMGGVEAQAVKDQFRTTSGRLSASDCRLLYNLLGSAGANFTTVNISGWGEANGPALKETVAEAAGRLGVVRPKEYVEAWTNPYAEGFRLQAETPGGDKVSVLGQTLLIAEHSFLMASFTTRDESRLQAAAGELYPLFRDGRVAVTVCGVLERPLSSAEMLAEAERLLAEAGAAEVEKTAADRLVNVTGYTGQLPGGLRYAGRKVNLNIALRCNPAEQKTYIYIATPLIFIEY
ncbi:MAG: YwmB family TATA-box binding protein, partial [Bacillota bacterium]